MNPVQIISRKRDGRELTSEEISFFIKGFASGRIPNYQMSALAMAIYLKGMSLAETAALTDEMLASGKTLQWSPAGSISLPLCATENDSIPRLERVTALQPSLQTASVGDGPETGIDARDTVLLGDLPIDPELLKLASERHAAFDRHNSKETSANVSAVAETHVFPVPPGILSNDDSRVALLRGAVVDKHSTGGLGDKTSLILAPILACCGLRVPMISGRGLGATGGTLDKLESIPGFRTNLSLDEIRELTEHVGCVITGATPELAPADHKLYALRDVTATVASIPMITASIMSKKLAEGLNALVLDVKWGSGAFMKTLANARKLAESLVATGNRNGTATVALLTNMDQPLGRMVGNTLEIDEALDALGGKGPPDLWQMTSELAIELLLATRLSPSYESAKRLVLDQIESGRAMTKFREMVHAQGGNLEAERPRAEYQFEIRSTRTGYVSKLNAESLGLAVIELGGGRRVLSDSVDHSVGLEMLVRIGDRVQVGQPLVRVHCRKEQADVIRPLIRSAIPIRTQPLESPTLITERVA